MYSFDKLQHADFVNTYERMSDTDPCFMDKYWSFYLTSPQAQALAGKS
jgi:hypothetical protein